MRVPLAVVGAVVLLASCSSGGQGQTAAAPPSAIVASSPPVVTPASDAATSSVGLLDEDDGATGSAAAILSTPAASMDATATAVGRLAGEPDPVLTPGALNPAVTQATIGTTICVSGWTATIRPPSSYTTALKVQQIAQYGYADTSTTAYEEDHLIPLQLGGAPSDPLNLWPQPYAATLPDGRDVGARVKDAFETSLKRQVCAGTVSLTAAQAQIGVHWVHAYYGIPAPTEASMAPATAAPTTTPTIPPAPSPTTMSLPPSTAATAPTAFTVSFVSLPDPAVPGSTASLEARTSPGAVCAARVTWPSGTVSAAAGLKATPTAGDDGLVSWTWNVGATTKGGTAKAAVTCTLGTSVTATAAFAVE